MTDGNMSVIGRETLWMISVFTLGKMEECMKDSIRTTKSMATASILGLIRKSTLDGGIRASSMV
jgi:hypothetical protein